MFDLNLFGKILWPDLPKFPNTRKWPFEELLPDGLTMGTLFIGKQGSGKTTALARHIVDQFKRFPKRAIFVLDPSGSLTDDILAIILSEPKDVCDRLLERVIYDELDHPIYTKSMPAFHKNYKTPMENQVQRIAQNLRMLSPELVTSTPVMGGIPLKEVAPELFRLLIAIRPDKNNPNYTWQLTEAKKLLVYQTWMKAAVDKFGGNAPSAKFFFENFYMEETENEKVKRSYGLRAVLNDIESRGIRARIGSQPPSYTPGEVIDEGLLNIVNGFRLIRNEIGSEFLFTHSYSLIMDEISKRIPHNPNDENVALYIDELVHFFRKSSWAPELTTLAPQYRSRKLELYLVLQSLSQLSDELRSQIWSLGNIVSFSVFDFDDAFDLAQQLFPYNPQLEKFSAKTNTGQPISEPDRGQYLQIANDIRAMKHRECIVRRQRSEKEAEKYVLWVKRTKDVRINVSETAVRELKEELMKKRGILITDALKEINKRNFGKSNQAITEAPEV